MYEIELANSPRYENSNKTFLNYCVLIIFVLPLWFEIAMEIINKDMGTNSKKVCGQVSGHLGNGSHIGLFQKY